MGLEVLVGDVALVGINVGIRVGKGVLVGVGVSVGVGDEVEVGVGEGMYAHDNPVKLYLSKFAAPVAHTNCPSGIR